MPYQIVYKKIDAVIIQAMRGSKEIVDANFFLNADKSKNFEMNDKLKNVQFHEGLGFPNDKQREYQNCPFFQS